MVRIKFIAQNLKEEELKGLKTMFANIDTDKSGTITYDELKTGLEKLGSRLTETEVKQLLEDVRRDFFSLFPLITLTGFGWFGYD